ncbi:cell wall hydrolase [Sphingobium sp. AN558]|uniref:cell wall hydrolase n=1 Tax=Sphingobium sp. AN558 TaxID=3133442 RepID=UPI0030C4FAB9
MSGDSSKTQPHPAMWLLWLALFVGLPALVASWESGAAGHAEIAFPPVAAALARRPSTPPPAVEPVRVYALETDQARALNAAIPFLKGPAPAARPFRFSGSETDLARATDCLAAAQIYEAGDDAVGEKAVAQVVLNRVRHPAFPGTVCGVVFQGQERATGCQFTFSCDGALARTPSAAAWDRARAIAGAALRGQVYRPVGYATHYHTDWVVPYWSKSLDKVAAVGTHLFFRWRGWWGTPPAFRKSGAGGEPLIGRIARLSAAHVGAPDVPSAVSPLPTGEAGDIAALPQQMIGADALGKTVGGVRLIAIVPGTRAFLVELGRGTAPDKWPAMALTFCAGRPECRIMAWRAGAAPAGLPLSDAKLEAMAFAYIHNVGSGLQRALWNCAQSPRANHSECMRQRLPTTVPAKATAPELKGVRRKERFETVTIGPVAPPVEKPSPRDK